MNLNKQFIKYVSQNILGMVGISLYILADTFFISKYVGADGITALNLVLPIYSLIFAIGSMMGVGSAIRFAISKNKYGKDQEGYFFNAIFFTTILGIIFTLTGLFFADNIVGMLGGDESIIKVGAPYTRIFMLFSPCFMWNYVCNAFVRNDGAPSIAMAATLFSSLFNIVFDYILMFTLDMGMSGAALATAISPIIGILICCTHLFSKKCNVNKKIVKPSLKRAFFSCQVGVSAFVGEMSSGVTTMIFNFIMLILTGNVGVAAYGVVANTALVAVSVLNGVSQGSQPLVSEYYGKGDKQKVKQIAKMGLATSLLLSSFIILIIYIFNRQITKIFNSENDIELAKLAENGLKLYFLGFIFAGLNIVGTGILSAIEYVRGAFVTSIMRGFIAISCCAIIMSMIFGMNGVWLAFLTAEGITAIFMVFSLKKALV